VDGESEATVLAQAAVVGFFLADPLRAHKAVAIHHPDDRGACAGCHTQRVRTDWPCIVALLAQQALNARPIPMQRRPPAAEYRFPLRNPPARRAHQ
jgi:hypothetical protein